MAAHYGGFEHIDDELFKIGKYADLRVYAKTLIMKYLHQNLK